MIAIPKISFAFPLGINTRRLCKAKLRQQVSRSHWELIRLRKGIIDENLLVSRSHWELIRKTQLPQPKGQYHVSRSHWELILATPVAPACESTISFAFPLGINTRCRPEFRIPKPDVSRSRRNQFRLHLMGELASRSDD